MRASGKKRILIIEDEHHIAEGLALNLSLKGHATRIAASGGEGLQQWKAWQPDLIVLDIMLPGIDGMSILRNIRLEDDHLPVLILSAKSDAEDKVKGFSFGVDDYLAKPFHLEEFLLRVERLLFRAPHSDSKAVLDRDDQEKRHVYAFGGNWIDFRTATAYGQRGNIDLTELEVKLLKLFVTSRGKTVSRGQLLEIGWGYDRRTQTRTVDNFIVRFRKYFEPDPKHPIYFRSVRSVGYVFDHGHQQADHTMDL
ncbi:MAG: response regulator transcription factor [Desulfatitalea sp.]|nr:response regulator transcription factor [Desulfatitalea sp.]NNJ99585.1 response regulator transcription factor [Desulfatitalea sp.]